MTQKRLANIAQHYIERFATTAANLKRACSSRRCAARQARSWRRCPSHGGMDRRGGGRLVTRAGAVDDARYAHARANLRCAAWAAARQEFAHTLLTKGVSADLAREALDATAENRVRRRRGV